jgi:hypothetical protein
VHFVVKGSQLVLVPETLAVKLRMIEGLRGMTKGGKFETDSLLEDRRLEDERELREEG